MKSWHKPGFFGLIMFKGEEFNSVQTVNQITTQTGFFFNSVQRWITAEARALMDKWNHSTCSIMSTKRIFLNCQHAWLHAYSIVLGFVSTNSHTKHTPPHNTTPRHITTVLLPTLWWLHNTIFFTIIIIIVRIQNLCSYLKILFIDNTILIAYQELTLVSLIVMFVYNLECYWLTVTIICWILFCCNFLLLWYTK